VEVDDDDDDDDDEPWSTGHWPDMVKKETCGSSEKRGVAVMVW
jgi:hypothetical protein